jgi:predicted RNA binding protein YcfA (HicA-like mRNA interferase family)
MNAKDLIKLLTANGWTEVRQKGSHKVFKHVEKKNTLVVAVHSNSDIPIGTLNALLKQAGLK